MAVGTGRAVEVLVVVLLVGALLVFAHHQRPRVLVLHPVPPSTTTTLPPTTTTELPTTTTTVPPPPPPPVHRQPLPAVRRPVPAPAPAAPSHACPPNPNIPGVEYRCYPGAAEGHRGLSCMNYPGTCPGSAFIAVDPTRTSNPNCVLANEVWNTNHFRAGYSPSQFQVDPNGSCP